MKRWAFIFILTSVAAYTLLASAYNYYNAHRKAFLVSESEAIQVQLEERFRFYVRGSQAIEKMAAQFWNRPVVAKSEFNALGESILSIYPEVLGANYINAQGQISMVYPMKDNAQALGKKTQNFALLMTARQQGGGNWMSPPFDLYQGEQGFVFYLPLNRNKQFLGWYGIVVSKKRFFDQFLHQGPFRNFHILLSDAETGKEYISTGVPPVETEEFRLREAKFRALGREIRMLTWHKAPQIFSHEWPLLTAITLAIATLMTASWEFFSQRKQSRRQVAELNALLGHIIHDTTNSVTTIKGYVEMMKDDPQLVPLDRVAKHVGFVVDLLDQIKLVRSLSDASISWTQVRQPILPLVIEAGELLDHRLQAKRLSLSYNPDTLGPLQSVLNSNLFIHAVLTNILSAMIELSQVGSQITVGQCTVDGEMRLHFVNPLARGLLEKSAELSLQIAVKVMELQHGHCKVDLSSNGLSVQITLPA